MKLKTIIVEDEILGQEALCGILEMYCADKVDVVEVVATVKDAIRSIQNNSPDLVFLDIKLGSCEDGAFEVLETLGHVDFALVFTTSSNQPESILKALNKYGVIKYILKPLEIDEVIQSVNMAMDARAKRSLETQIDQIRNLLDVISVTGVRNTIQIPLGQGFRCLKYEEIIMIRGMSNHTLIFLTSGESLENTNSLKFYSANLPTGKFIRVSKSYIINLEHVESFSKKEGGTILLSGACSAKLSSNHRKDFFKALNYEGH